MKKEQSQNDNRSSKDSNIAALIGALVLIW